MQSILYNRFVNIVLGRPQQKHTQSEVKCPFQHDQRCLRVGLEVHFIDTRLTLGVETVAHPKNWDNFFRVCVNMHNSYCLHAGRMYWRVPNYFTSSDPHHDMPKQPRWHHLHCVCVRWGLMVDFMSASSPPPPRFFLLFLRFLIASSTETICASLFPAGHHVRLLSTSHSECRKKFGVLSNSLYDIPCISSDIMSGISWGILSDILKILSDIYSDILCYILSDISSDHLFDILSAISSDILFDILSDISSDILSDILSDMLSNILSGKASDILSGIPSGILSEIPSDISSDVLCGISPAILSGILFQISVTFLQTFVCHPFCNLFWHSFWHLFWHSFRPIFWHSVWHFFWHLVWHSVCHLFWHYFCHLFWHSFWHLSWHPFWHSFWHLCWNPVCWLRPGRERWQRRITVEARKGTLAAQDRGWARRRRTRTRRRWEEERRRRRGEEENTRRRWTHIKSNNPHLTGGEKHGVSRPSTNLL